MRIHAVIALLLAPAAYPQTASIQAIQPQPNRLEATYRAVATQPPQMLVERTDMIFPHIAMGGGWNTAFVIVNIAGTSVPFVQNFYDEAGKPLTVTVQTPDGNTTTLSSMQTTLAPGASVKFTLVSTSQDTQVGWPGIVYDSSAGRLSGYASFRLNVNGVVNEGLVPLSAYDDSWFVMPFDNTEGYGTGLALCNPGSNATDHVTVTAVDLTGNTIATETVTIPPGGHVSYVVTDQNHMPQLVNTAGSLIVQSDTTVLSGMGIRMNSSAGFTSIPIMNFIPGV